MGLQKFVLYLRIDNKHLEKRRRAEEVLAPKYSVLVDPEGVHQNGA